MTKPSKLTGSLRHSRNDKDWKLVGRRFSKRLTSHDGGLEDLTNELYRRFNMKTLEELKQRTAAVIEAGGIDVAAALKAAERDGVLNPGTTLRRGSVVWIEGTESDSTIMLAARVYELCCELQLRGHDDQTVRDFYDARAVDNAFELGRLSMLMHVYETDEQLQVKAADSARQLATAKSEATREAVRQEFERLGPSLQASRGVAEIIAGKVSRSAMTVRTHLQALAEEGRIELKRK